ncbi:hypothetical protein, partial [Micromonospora echinospora]
SSPSCDVSASCGGAAVLVVEGVDEGAQGVVDPANVRPEQPVGNALDFYLVGIGQCREEAVGRRIDGQDPVGGAVFHGVLSCGEPVRTVA